METVTKARIFDESLQNFVSKLQEMINEHFKKHYKNLTPPTIICEGGSKYVRVVKQEPSSRSVHCFVEIATGGIFKAASWKKPAKHARGNIYNENPLEGVGVYGANYLK